MWYNHRFLVLCCVRYKSLLTSRGPPRAEGFPWGSRVERTGCLLATRQHSYFKVPTGRSQSQHSDMCFQSLSYSVAQVCCSRVQSICYFHHDSQLLGSYHISLPPRPSLKLGEHLLSPAPTGQLHEGKSGRQRGPALLEAAAHLHAFSPSTLRAVYKEEVGAGVR